MADDGVIDVGRGCDFDGGDAEGRARAIDATDAAASDTGGAEADEKQEKNPQGTAGASAKMRLRLPKGSRKTPRTARAVPETTRVQSRGK